MKALVYQGIGKKALEERLMPAVTAAGTVSCMRELRSRAPLKWAPADGVHFAASAKSFHPANPGKDFLSKLA